MTEKFNSLLIIAFQKLAKSVLMVYLDLLRAVLVTEYADFSIYVPINYFINI